MLTGKDLHQAFHAVIPEEEKDQYYEWDQLDKDEQQQIDAVAAKFIEQITTPLQGLIKGEQIFTVACKFFKLQGLEDVAWEHAEDMHPFYNEIAKTLNERHVIPALVKVETQKAQLAWFRTLVKEQQAWMDNIILPLGNVLDDPRAQQRGELRERTKWLLEEE